MGTQWSGPGEDDSAGDDKDDLDSIKKQLAELQDKLSKLS